MINELIEIYKENFPFIVREEKTVKNILENKENEIIERRNKKGKLIGVSVINKSAILLLCVDKKYRNQGIGTNLLKNSEELIKNKGYKEIILGVGFDYIMPGVPTSKKYFKSQNEKLYPNIDEKASNFFTKRGYNHSWDCNCFDMRFNLEEFKKITNSIGDTINKITYRWATIDDLERICNCTNKAEESFTKWYKSKDLYKENNTQRVLIATTNNEVVGTLIVSIETEGKNLGSVGCTAVIPKYQHQCIATNMIILGTKYLKDIGMREAYLGYTYTGLDKLYGTAGYKICIYYMMAKKEL